MLSHNELNTPPPEVIHVDNNDDSIRKEYENMSYFEMSQRLAESYKEISQILGNRISIPSAASSSDSPITPIEEEEHYHLDEKVVERTDIDDQTKRAKCSKLLFKAVSSGDLGQLKSLLNDQSFMAYLDIDDKDEDGTTPLIYAACFGKLDIAQELLLAGAKTDSQDAHGWSALMWATTNNHEGLVKLLLNHGASAQTKSAKGRTVYDFVKSDSQKMADILAVSPRNSISSVSSIACTDSSAGDSDHYYQYTTQENYEQFLSLDNERRPKLMDEYLLNDDNDDDDYYSDQDEDNEHNEKEIEFYWDKCMPDQMFVFGADDLPYILDTVISKLTLPVRSVQEIFLPANVVFLCARFAHYFSSSELLEDVMEGGMSRMNAAVKKNSHEVLNLSYWLTNMTRLLYYLKKDTGLVVETAEYQLRLSELISETYNLIVNDVGKNITAILEPAMLEHDPILGMEDVNFSDDWQRFFRRSTSRRSTMDESAMQRTSSSISTVSTDVNVHHTPRSVTQILTYTLYVLQSYEIHSTIIIQALAQFFHTLSCELFNHILSKKKYLCRSKALQVRMNLSNIEDWIHNNNLPNSLVGYLNPTIQLLQLLQCVSQLSDVESFKSTIATFDTINPLQIKRCVSGYRYEINEPRLSEAVERYVYHCVDETIRYKQARRQSRSFDRRKSGPPHVNSIQSQALRRSLSGRESMNQIMGSFMSSVGIVPTLSNVSNVSQEPLAHEENDEVEDKDINETKDARFMLPFFVPTTAQLSNINGWSQRKESKERVLLVPVITDEWMDKLDKNNQI